jgi:hypothetical protein
MTCHISDKLINSLLGRPATTTGIHDELSTIIGCLNPSGDPSLSNFRAVSEIVTIIDRINTELYTKRNCRPAVVEQLLQAIDGWRHNFWPSLAQGSRGATNSSVIESPRTGTGLMGIVHVSCLYYFAIILASRPVFVSTLSTHWTPDPEEKSMCEACLDAAVYLTETCAEAHEAGLLKSNMCIVEWVSAPHSWL